jgi:flap endonuclease-1
MEEGLKIVYVFDGKPHKFKTDVLRKRSSTRSKAKKEYEKALDEGDAEKARKFGQQSVVASQDIVEDAKELLTRMGIPCVQAPGEGEAQTAFMAREEDIWCAASQDYDSLLYGAPRYVRNLSVTGRRKLPGKNVYIKIEPELFEFQRVLSQLEVTREQLVDIGILIGTDYNPEGIKGIGPKTALKLIQEHKDINKALKQIENAEFPHPVDEIKDLFLNPRVTYDYELEWEKPDTAAIIGFLCGKHDFSQSRVMSAIEKMNKGFKITGERTTLDRFFG